MPQPVPARRAPGRRAARWVVGTHLLAGLAWLVALPLMSTAAPTPCLSYFCWSDRTTWLVAGVLLLLPSIASLVVGSLVAMAVARRGRVGVAVVTGLATGLATEVIAVLVVLARLG